MSAAVRLSGSAQSVPRRCVCGYSGYTPIYPPLCVVPGAGRNESGHCLSRTPLYVRGLRVARAGQCLTGVGRVRVYSTHPYIPLYMPATGHYGGGDGQPGCGTGGSWCPSLMAMSTATPCEQIA